VPASVTAFFLGGTIGMLGHHDGEVHRLDAEELIGSVPQLAGLDVELEAENFRSLPSACLSFDDVLDLVAAAAERRADGIVVVQGTDTLEETAYLIDLVWPHGTPVVVTGAMRNPSMAGPDGPANLLAAVQVAASPHFRDLGALVVFNDQVHAARFVRKTHSTSTATFASPNAGPIGILVEGQPVRLARVDRRRVLEPDRSRGARVALHVVAMDDDGGGLVGLADRYDGLVVGALGVGHVPERLADPLVDAARRIPVVLASRTGAGPVLSRTYGFVGSESHLLGGGLLSAGLLDPFKARILLKVALDCGYSSDELAQVVAEASGSAAPWA
jgi:L-asparaginase